MENVLAINDLTFEIAPRCSVATLLLRANSPALLGIDGDVPFPGLGAAATTRRQCGNPSTIL